MFTAWVDEDLMKRLSACLLCSYALIACGRPSAPDQPSKPLATRVSSNALPLGADYGKAVKAWGQLYYSRRPEEDIYQMVKRVDMHYQYAAFLELFPGSAHRTEIETLMQRFSIFDATERTTVAIDVLKKKYNYDGDNDISPWNNAFAGFVVGHDADRVFRAPLCYGNLQLLSGGFIHRKTALEFQPGTKLIYRSES